MGETIKFIDINGENHPIDADLLDGLHASSFALVTDLANYYTKSQTYSQSEINELIGAITEFDAVVTTELPTASESTMKKIYLIPSDGEGQNSKDEYITWLDGNVYKWEKIGSTDISLDGYATEDYVDEKIEHKQDTLESGTNIKTINGESILGSGDIAIKPMVETTYSALKALRDFGDLVPGTQYRITDYVTTTVQANTQSAGHVFDIIVTADSENTLNENARAILHDGDTYFSNYDLNAWQLKYCIDNDDTRFVWADTSNGKGVIYYMKDEFNNECPYDFKNIQFKVGSKTGPGTIDNVYYYTFSLATGTDDATVTDHSLNRVGCYGNVIKEYVSSNKIQLNIIVFRNTGTTINCFSNTFENNCYGNTFGTNCRCNTFGNECYNNTFGNTCFRNMFPYSCYGNTFGNECYNNTFGINCYGNTFNKNCQSNIFGIHCYGNTFGNNCNDNTFGNECYGTAFGNFCSNNTFGNRCNNNTFGNYCIGNTFRNDCKYIKFGNASATKSYCRYIMIDNGCQYLYITTILTTSSSNYLQNVHICQGIIGTTLSSRKTITIDTVNQNYQIEYKAANSVTNII